MLNLTSLVFLFVVLGRAFDDFEFAPVSVREIS